MLGESLLVARCFQRIVCGKLLARREMDNFLTGAKVKAAGGFRKNTISQFTADGPPEQYHRRG